MFIRAYLRASTTDQDADRAKNELQAFAHEHNVRIGSGKLIDCLREADRRIAYWAKVDKGIA